MNPIFASISQRTQKFIIHRDFSQSPLLLFSHSSRFPRIALVLPFHPLSFCPRHFSQKISFLSFSQLIVGVCLPQPSQKRGQRSLRTSQALQPFPWWTLWGGNGAYSQCNHPCPLFTLSARSHVWSLLASFAYLWVQILRSFHCILTPSQHKVQRIPKLHHWKEAKSVHPLALVKSVFKPNRKEQSILCSKRFSFQKLFYMLLSPDV